MLQSRATLRTMRHAIVILLALAGSLRVIVHSDNSDDANDLHAAGVAAHLEGCLGDAKREYDAALARVPPVPPTDVQRSRVLRLAPRVFVNAREPFALKDVAAIVHPSERVIAYHLFWEDDIDFPDDNEPSDHEVVWVRYDADDRVSAVSTLFHGRVVNMAADRLAGARRNGSRLRVDVQWGKHGPMPEGWSHQTIETEAADGDTGIPAEREMTLLEYNRLSWLKLSTEGTRSRQHPLSIRYGWPSRFAGDFAAFTSFTREVDVRGLLELRKLMLVSQWNSGPLARYLLLYNFHPKLEWPDSEE